MTSNQVNYWNLQENKRHNLVTEEETAKHNRATEQYSLSALQETSRHNYATEAVASQTQEENVRANKARESFNIGQLNESARHNLATEQVSAREADIKQQSVDLSKLAQQETERSNRARERISWAQVSNDQQRVQIARQEADTNLTKTLADIQLDTQRVEELQRHNKAVESTANYEASIKHLATNLDVELAKVTGIANNSRVALTQAQIYQIQRELDIAAENLNLAKERANYENLQRATQAAKNISDIIQSGLKQNQEALKAAAAFMP